MKKLSQLFNTFCLLIVFLCSQSYCVDSISLLEQTPEGRLFSEHILAQLSLFGGNDQFLNLKKLLRENEDLITGMKKSIISQSSIDQNTCFSNLRVLAETLFEMKGNERKLNARELVLSKKSQRNRDFVTTLLEEIKVIQFFIKFADSNLELIETKFRVQIKSKELLLSHFNTLDGILRTNLFNNNNEFIQLDAKKSTLISSLNPLKNKLSGFVSFNRKVEGYQLVLGNMIELVQNNTETETIIKNVRKLNEELIRRIEDEVDKEIEILEYEETMLNNTRNFFSSEISKISAQIEEIQVSLNNTKENEQTSSVLQQSEIILQLTNNAFNFRTRECNYLYLAKNAELITLNKKLQIISALKDNLNAPIENLNSYFLQKYGQKVNVLHSQ